MTLNGSISVLPLGHAIRAGASTAARMLGKSATVADLVGVAARRCGDHATPDGLRDVQRHAGAAVHGRKRQRRILACSRWVSPHHDLVYVDDPPELLGRKLLARCHVSEVHMRR
jgi:hypothetical protein